MMGQQRRRVSVPLEPVIEAFIERRGPAFRVEVEAARAELMLEHQLAVLRDKEGVTQAELARRLGVSQPVVARFESLNKNRGVEVATIVRYAAALGYEFIATFKKMSVAKGTRAVAASVRPATKRSTSVTGKGSRAARRSKPRGK
jgi:DNA-binding XRE family transcriptional regulator